MPNPFEAAYPYNRLGERDILTMHQIAVVGGIDARRDPILKDDFQVSDLTNVDPFRTGTYLTGPGVDFRARSATHGANTPYGLIQGSDADIYYLFAHYGGYVVPYRGGAFVDTTSLGNYGSPSQIVQCLATHPITGNGVMCLASSVLEGDRQDIRRWYMDDIWNWTVSDDSSYEPRCLLWHLGRLWAGCGKDLYWSASLNGLDMAGGAGVSLGISGTDEIMAILPVRDTSNALLIFSKRSVSLFVYTIIDTWLEPSASELRTLTTKVGTVATRSVVDVGDTVVFLAEDGVRVMSRGADDQIAGSRPPVSEPIQPYIDRISWAYVQRAQAVWYREKYWLAVPLDGATLNTHLLVWDMRSNGKSGWTVYAIPCAGLARWTGEGNKDQLAVLYGESVTEGGGAGYHLYVMDDAEETLAASGSIVHSCETRGFTFGVPELRKVDQDMTLAARAVGSTDVGITAKIRGDRGAWSTLGTITVSAATTPVLPSIAIPATINSPGFTEVRFPKSRNVHAYEVQYRLEGTHPLEIRRLTARAHLERDL